MRPISSLVCLVMTVPIAAAELPDIASVPPDLVVPEMTEGEPKPGLRVRQTTPGWEATDVYHALFLPVGWEPGRRFPVIVEWAGNGGYSNAFGDVSTGRVEDSRLGYGLTADRSCIWLCVPFLNNAGTANVSKWWGEPPSYDPEPTLAYLRATIKHMGEKFGGDLERVVLAGFSRGAIAVNYLGLHDEQTARLWRAFVCFSHYDGVRTGWPYPGADRASAKARLRRLAGRPQFICGEGNNAADTERYLRETGGWEMGAFTVSGTGFRNHNDAWILRPSEGRERVRAWLDAVLR
jgi:hypothetical protein